MAIQHLVDLDPKELESICHSISRYPETFTFTEKLDGTCNASMFLAKQFNSNKVEVGFARPSKGQDDIIFQVGAFSIAPHHNCFRAALSVFQLINNKYDFHKWMTAHAIDQFTIEFEVLLGNRPNAIKYDAGNVLVSLRILGPQSVHAKELFKQFCDDLVVDDVYDVPVFQYKYMRKKDDLEFTLRQECVTEQFKIKRLKEYKYNDLNKVFKFSANMTHEERLKTLNEGVLTIPSFLSPIAVPVEGVIIHHKNSNTLYKIVNKQHFTKTNNFIWDVRSRIQGGRVKNGAWRKSHYQNFLDRVAEALGVPILKTPMAIKHYRDNGDKAEDITKIAFHTLMNDAFTLKKISNLFDDFEREIKNMYVKYVERQKKDAPYDKDVDERTRQTFYHMFARIAEIKYQISEISKPNEPIGVKRVDFLIRSILGL